MNNIDDILKERGSRYGSFWDEALICNAILFAFQYELAEDTQSLRERDGWTRLAPDQKHALRYIAGKLARILNGDPAYADNWLDGSGYFKLIADRLSGTAMAAARAEFMREAIRLQEELLKEEELRK